jgi:hypothetical protein
MQTLFTRLFAPYSIQRKFAFYSPMHPLGKGSQNNNAEFMGFVLIGRIMRGSQQNPIFPFQNWDKGGLGGGSKAYKTLNK